MALAAGETRAAPLRQDVAVQVKDTIFEPFSITVQQGTIVTWSHLGRLTHTVTSDDGLFDSGEMDTGATFSARFNAVGTFGYHCTIHGSPRSGMSGTIVVTPGDGTTPLEPLQPPTPQQPETDTGEPVQAAQEEPPAAPPDEAVSEEPQAEEPTAPQAEEPAQPANEAATQESVPAEDRPEALPEVGMAFGSPRLLVALALAALALGVSLRGGGKPPDG
jgi:plastocyanin